LNVKKALEVVKQFEMVWPDKQGNDASFKPPLGAKQQIGTSKPTIFDASTTGER